MVLLLLCAAAVPAQAAEFVVANDQASGSGSLLAAIELANATMGPDTITFDSGFFATPRSIPFMSLPILDSVTIRGPGRDRLTLQGVSDPNPRHGGKILPFAPPGTPGLVTVFEHLTIRAEDSAPSNRLFSAENHALILRDVHLQGSGELLRNSAAAAISIVDAELVLEDCLVENFYALGNGGAINAWVSDAGDPTLQPLFSSYRTAFRNNASESAGGAVNIFTNEDLNGVSVLIRDSEFSANTGYSRGGAIHIMGPLESAISNSTFSGNTTDLNYGGAIEVVNNRFASGSLSVDSSTLINNAAGSLGGAISSLGINAPSIQIANSVIAGNRLTLVGAGRSQDIYSEAAVLISHSLIGDHVGANPTLTILDHQNTVGSNLLDTDPMLAALSNNGGPTRTHAIRQGSPLLDAGNINTPTRNQSLSQPTNDQRGAGYARVSNSSIDIGAYEFQVSSGGGNGGGSSGGGGGMGAGMLVWLALFAAIASVRSQRNPCRARVA